MLKRSIDILGASFGLLFLSPIILVVALKVRSEMGSPVFFRQTRPGRHGKPFQMIKFRTMRHAIDADGNPLPDAERLTKLGRFLRSSSLDELPELWNVLTGEMSLVGPRPLLMEYLPYFTPEERMRMNVRPGITGYAQIKGRNRMPWNDRLAADLYYVRCHNIRFDFRIIFETLARVLRRSDVIVDPRDTMQDLNVERARYINVRRLIENEIKVFGAILQSTLRPEFISGTIVAATKFPEFLQDVLAPRSEIFGIFRNNDLVGGYQAIEKPNYLHLNYFAVLQGERGWGTADLLMRELKRHAGDRELYLHVDSRNMEALKFYRKQGFKEAERTKYTFERSRGDKPLSEFPIIDWDKFNEYGIGYISVAGTQVGIIERQSLILDEEVSPEVAAKCLVVEQGLEIRGPSCTFEALGMRNDSKSFYLIRMSWKNQS